MIRRDFTKSNKEFFAQNRILLACLTAFLVVGAIVAIFFGFNQNFEMGGYYTFEISMTGKAETTYSKSIEDINTVVNAYGGQYDTTLIAGEGDATQFVVRYTKKISAENITKLNHELATKLGIELTSIESHEYVKPVAKAKDYVFTATAILLLVALTSVFAFFRYNGASALAIIVACTVGTLGFMSFTAILRLSVGLSYFAMLVILNALIVYFAIDIFEHINKSTSFINRDYGETMVEAIKSKKFRLCLVSILILVMGTLFVLFGTATLKGVAQNIMFMVVSVIATVMYIIPFVWNICIPYCRTKTVKIEATDKEKTK